MRAWCVALCICGCAVTADGQPAGTAEKGVPVEKRYRLQKGDKEWLGYRAVGDPSSFVTCGLTPLPIENGLLKETEEPCPEGSRPFRLADLRVLKIRKAQGGQVAFEDFAEPAEGAHAASIDVAIKDLTLELQSGKWTATKILEGKTTRDSPWAITDGKDPASLKMHNLNAGDVVVLTYKETKGETAKVVILDVSKGPM